MKRLQYRLHTIIYEADTPAGRLFDVLLHEMKQSYPELETGKDLIVETLKNEEEKFSSLLER